MCLMATKCSPFFEFHLENLLLDEILMKYHHVVVRDPAQIWERKKAPRIAMRPVAAQHRIKQLLSSSIVVLYILLFK